MNAIEEYNLSDDDYRVYQELEDSIEEKLQFIRTACKDYESWSQIQDDQIVACTNQYKQIIDDYDRIADLVRPYVALVYGDTYNPESMTVHVLKQFSPTLEIREHVGILISIIQEREIPVTQGDVSSWWMFDDALVLNHSPDSYNIMSEWEEQWVNRLHNAEQGNAQAQLKLGQMYSNGEDVAQDYEQAIYWYTKAAEQGIGQAQSELGYMLVFGSGITKDYERAFDLFTKAAEQGNVDGQNNLGCCYKDGEGVAQDYEQAIYWLTKAAEQGHSEAQFELGDMYVNGVGVKKSLKSAAYWISFARENNHVKAGRSWYEHELWKYK